MAYFQFLGTGPSTPILDASGRNVRRRSAALMQHISTYILLDVTHDFEEQVERALSVTGLVVTNPSRDAAGGIGNLDRWIDNELAVYAPDDLWAELERRYGPFTHLRQAACEPGQTVTAGDLELTPFRVFTARGKKPPPTYGYLLDNGKKRICYASDVKFIPEESEPFFKGNDLLVVDAAGWDKDLPTHRGALNHLHEYVAWENTSIVFTHIGRSAPPHTQANSVVRGMSNTAQVAYDFMKLPLGR